MWHLFHQQKFLKQYIFLLWKSHEHNNISWPLYSVFENWFFILHNLLLKALWVIFLKQIPFIRLYLIAIQVYSEFDWTIWLFSEWRSISFSAKWCSVPKNFSYSLENYSILLKKFYLYNPRNFEHLTQGIWGSLAIRYHPNHINQCTDGDSLWL